MNTTRKPRTMTLSGIAKRIFSVFALLLFSLALYEAGLVWKAQQASPAVIAAALAKPQDLPLSSLSDTQKAILLKVEDPGFYDHKGIDFASPGQGLTTITQALVKFLYFEKFTPGFAKIEQSLIARFVLNNQMTKDQQLGLLINQAYFGDKNGEPIRGFSDAALAHFSKPFSQLSDDEFIGLVAMLIGPNKFRPDKDPETHKSRVTKIKQLLAGDCKPNGLLDVYYDDCV
ncbi:MAG: transglycosylase domain-containing protein [Rhizobiaceae bacterium]